MRKISLASRVRYRFDNLVSRGSAVLIGMLALGSVVTVVAIGLVGWLAGVAPEGEPPPEGADGFAHVLWMGLMRTLDSGTMGGDQGAPHFLVVMLSFTIAGIFVVSTFIGLLTSGIEAKIEELRKGRSLVVENDHILVLGWSSKIATVLDQLIEANQSHPKPRIVILAEKDKVEMEDEIASRVRKPGRVRIICRTGSPIDIGDLEIVNPDGARAILILSPEDDDPDSGAIKSVLALVNNPGRTREKYHIVAELEGRENIEVVKMVAGDEVETLDAHALIARMMVQTCRQSGLSAVYSDLLDFGGVEIYFTSSRGLAGRTFGDALLAFETSSVIGVRTAAAQILLNPPTDTKLGPGDDLIVIAEDDSAIHMSGVDERVDTQAFADAAPQPRKPERTLIVGWNGRGSLMVNELDQYVAPGSELKVVADLGTAAEDLARDCAGVKNLSISHEVRDTTGRRELEALDVPSYDHVILLCYSGQLAPQKADARTLVTLLHLRRIAQTSGARFSIVSEMLDVRNRQLAEAGRADDFIVSDRLVSLLMAQVAESKDLNAVFTDLFDPEGCEIYLKPAKEYVTLGTPVSFRTVVASARRRGEVAIGCRVAARASAAANAFGVVLNPAKASHLTFGDEDRVIVIAES
ncbi:MAG: potassium transporter TrkA [Myxococcales bacterium]|nr:potassium transporter TrkA [Myxococcales bacterium]